MLNAGGQERMIGKAVLTRWAMVLHELATNAVKYGSLSSEAGTLDVSTRANGNQINLIWTERGGPPVKAPPPKAEGFGSKLVKRSVTWQLGGTIEHEWAVGGLIVTVQLDRSKLSR